MSLSLVSEGFSKMVGAFRSFNGPSSSIKVTGKQFTNADISGVVQRSFGRPGAKVSGLTSVSRQIPILEIGITAEFKDSFDTVLDSIRREVHATVTKAAAMIKDASFQLCPRDTGRLERTATVVDNSVAGDWPVSFSIEYGPAIDPETGDDYTAFVHFGDYNPGPGTQAKGLEAGPLFLTRPVESLHDVIIDMIVDAVKRGIARAA